MKRIQSLTLTIAALTILTLTFAGCNEVTRWKLVGQWEADVADATLDRFDIGQSSDTNIFKRAASTVIKDIAKSVAQRVDANVSMHFKSDGSFTTVMSVADDVWHKKSGTWSVASSKGRTTIVDLTYDESNEKQQITLTFVGDNQFEAAPPVNVVGTKPARFTRVSSSSD